MVLYGDMKERLTEVGGCLIQERDDTEIREESSCSSEVLSTRLVDLEQLGY